MIIIQKVGNTHFIGIDGHGGAGKSTIARELAKKLHAEIIHLDDFVSQADDTWWQQVIEQVFIPIKNGAKKLSYSKAPWWAGESQVEDQVVDQPVSEIMVVEGVGALRPEFRPFISFGIFVDVPVAVCFERGVARDIADVPSKSEAEIREMWQKWHTKEAALFADYEPKKHADVVIDGTKSVGDQLFGKIMQEVELKKLKS